MFKASSILTDTAMQLLLPLADCSVNDTLVKVVPFLKQWFFCRCSMSRIPALTYNVFGGT